MIIKLIEAKARPRGIDRYAHHLARYIATGDRRELGPDAVGIDYGLTLSAYMAEAPRRPETTKERVLFRAALAGGEARSWEDGLADVEQRLAKRSSKVKKPVRHVVLSCRAGEHLTEVGCVRAVATLAKELGCESAAILWAAHGDTDNFHLHMMFVTIDPQTGGALSFGRGANGSAAWKEAMQRAIARIEHAEQLQPEAGARYRMQGDEVIRTEAPQHDIVPKRTPIRQEVLDWEERTGFASFTRFAQEVAGPVLDDASSWAKLHDGLAPYGIGIRSAGRGGEIYAEDEHVKLSSIDRRHSWSKLVKRLGPYEPPEKPTSSHYEPRVLDAGKARQWLRRADQERAIGARVDQRVAALRVARDAALAEADASLSAHRADVAGFAGDERLRRDLGSAWPRLRAATVASIRTAFAARIEAARALRHAAAQSDDIGLVDLEAIGLPDVGIVAPWFAEREPPQPSALAGYEAERAGVVVHYWKEGHQRRGQPALVDAGAIIWVNDRSDRSIAAALTLAQARYGKVAVCGDAAYLRQCARVSRQLDIPITAITVAEARDRARLRAPERRLARQRALDAHGRKMDDDARRRAWLRAYRHAAPSDSPVVGLDPLPTPSEVPHHASVPTINENLHERSSDMATRTRKSSPPVLDVGIG